MRLRVASLTGSRLAMSANGPQAAVGLGTRPLLLSVISAHTATVEDAGQIRAPSRFEVGAQQDGKAIADPGSSRHRQRS